MRKIVQIATRAGFENPDCSYPPALYAVCDDGSAWVMGESGWKKLQKIPQPGDVVTPEIRILNDYAKNLPPEYHT